MCLNKIMIFFKAFTSFDNYSESINQVISFFMFNLVLFIAKIKSVFFNSSHVYKRPFKIDFFFMKKA